MINIFYQRKYAQHSTDDNKRTFKAVSLLFMKPTIKIIFSLRLMITKIGISLFAKTMFLSREDDMNTFTPLGQSGVTASHEIYISKRSSEG